MFDEEPKGCILVRKNECKKYLFLFTRKLHWAPLCKRSMGLMDKPLNSDLYNKTAVIFTR